MLDDKVPERVFSQRVDASTGFHQVPFIIMQIVLNVLRTLYLKIYY